MARRHKDDSNRFIVSLTMFNRTVSDPLVIVVLLAVLAMYGVWIYQMFRKATT